MNFSKGLIDLVGKLPIVKEVGGTNTFQQQFVKRDCKPLWA
ncbi:MAG: hypothetical protein AAGA53_02695 [Pseudomonadota bacterium]